MYAVNNADQLFIAYNCKRTSYTPLSNAIHYYEAAGWEIRNLSCGDRYQRFNGYTTYTRTSRSIRVPYNSEERVVHWNQTLHNCLRSSIFSSRPLVPGIASRDVIHLSDPDYDSENMASSQSEDSADDNMLDAISRIRKHAHAQTISSETNTASSKKNARTCPAP